jgi:hypothetical protein
MLSLADTFLEERARRLGHLPFRALFAQCVEKLAV